MPDKQLKVWNNLAVLALIREFMSLSPGLLLAVYCALIAACSLLGGLLPNWVRMTHTRTQMAMSFVSGLMLAVAFYHLVPHSLALAGGVAAADRVVWWLMLGLVAMLLLLRLFHFHQHDFSDEEHEHHHHGASEVSWFGLALGLGVHTLVDGIALGAVMQGEASHQGASLLGLGVFLAIALHKPLDAMSITAVMAAGGWSVAARRAANLGFAVLCPLGALLFYFGLDLVGNQQVVVALALAFSAGAFICIALSDLLPEVHFHSHDKGKLTVAFLLGIVLAYSIGVIEPEGSHVAHNSEGAAVWSNE